MYRWRIFSHLLGPMPRALATPDGFLQKTNMAALATLLQKKVQPAEQIPKNSAIFDRMCLVQWCRKWMLTICLLVMLLIQSWKWCWEKVHSAKMGVVYDIYQEMSIKKSKRSLRGEESGHHLQNITCAQIDRQWRRFLAKVNNKTAVCHDWVFELQNNRPSGPRGTCLIVQAIWGSWLFAPTCYFPVMICSEDTDIFIMSDAFADKIATSLFIKCGSRNCTKAIDIKRVGNVWLLPFIGMHAY